MTPTEPAELLVSMAMTAATLHDLSRFLRLKAAEEDEANED